MRRFVIIVALAFSLLGPHSTAAQTRCSNPIFDMVFEQLIGEIARSGLPAMMADDIQPLLDGVESLGAMATDACTAQQVSFLKAWAYTLARRMSEAEAIYTRELPPPDNPRAMSALELLAHAGRAAVFSFQRRDAEAEALVTLLLPEFRRRFGRNSSLTLALEGSLGDIHLAARNYAQALEVYRDISGRVGAVLPHDHPLRCGGLVNEAHAALGAGQTDRARQLLSEIRDPSTAACRGLTQTGSPWIARADRLWGALLLSDGAVVNAITALESAHQTALRVFGEVHPQSLEALFSLTEAYAVAGQREQAVASVSELNTSLKSWLDREIIGTSQRGARRNLVRGHDRLQELAIQIALAFPDLAAAQEAAGDAVLKFKSIQLEEEAALSRLLRSDAVDPRARQLATQLKDLRSTLAETLTTVPGDFRIPDRETVASITSRIETTEAELATATRYFARAQALGGGPTHAVQQALRARGPTSSLVEFMRIADRDLGDLRWMEPRLDRGQAVWTAVVMDAERVRVVKLADGKTVASLMEPLSDPFNQFLAREGAPSEQTNYRELLRIPQLELYRLLIAPLQLETSTQVILAPTAELSVAHPFAFRMEDGRYWIENEAQDLRLVQTGRTLLNGENLDPDRTVFLAVGGVDYGPLTADGAGWQFLNLALEESEKAAALFSSQTGHAVQVLAGTEATETRVKREAGQAQVLHLSVHGFYHHQDNLAAQKWSELLVDQPLLASGIVLAGANNGGSSSDDGVMYSVEIQDLDLEGLELVFLSACETGAGTVEGLEGAHGVPRAFMIAGARNIVSALRIVDEDHAQKFSDTFYEQWAHPSVQTPQQAYLAAIRQIIAEGDAVDWSAFTHFEG